MKRLADFHIHPNYSIDAEGSVDDYCRRAIEIGLPAICFTTHYDSNPNRIELDGYWHYKNRRVLFDDRLVGCYIDEVLAAGANYKEKELAVYCGLEIDYFPGVEKEVERVRHRFPLDFVIGSVHCLDDISISSRAEAPAYFSHKTARQMLDDYFGLLEKAIQCPGFDSIGHLDYFIRYSPFYYGNDAYTIEPERYDGIFELMKKNDVGFEINTSPYRYGKTGFHPERQIIKWAIDAGVKIASIGSDSHKPSGLGLGINDAYDFIDSLGIEPQFPGAL